MKLRTQGGKWIVTHNGVEIVKDNAHDAWAYIFEHSKGGAVNAHTR